MINKYDVGFDGTIMGCATLGYAEREGRDRTEEMRHYADFLRREGYEVTEVSEDPCYVRVRTDAGGIVRRPSGPDPMPGPGERYHIPPKEVYAAWLALRGAAPLAAVAEMLRQDLDGDLLTTVREDGQALLQEAERHLEAARGLILRAQGGIPYGDT